MATPVHNPILFIGVRRDHFGPRLRNFEIRRVKRCRVETEAQSCFGFREIAERKLWQCSGLKKFQFVGFLLNDNKNIFASLSGVAPPITPQLRDRSLFASSNVDAGKPTGARS